MNELDGMMWYFSNDSIDASTIWTDLALFSFVGNLLANVVLAKGVETWSPQSSQIRSTGGLFEKDLGAILAYYSKSVNDLFEVAYVKGWQCKLDVAKVTVTVLEVFLALFAIVGLGRRSESLIKGSMWKNFPFGAWELGLCKQVSIGDFRDRLLYYFLIGTA